MIALTAALSTCENLSMRERQPRPTVRERRCWALWGASLPRPVTPGYHERGWDYLHYANEGLLDRRLWLPYSHRRCVAVVRVQQLWFIPARAQRYVEEIRGMWPEVPWSRLCIDLDLGPWSCDQTRCIAAEQQRLRSVTAALAGGAG